MLRLRVRYSTDKILIQIGKVPQLLDVPGMADYAITSDGGQNLTALPEKIVIYGSGYIALEFAGIFNGLGAETHLVYRGQLPLRGFDGDIQQHIATALADRGIILHHGRTIAAVQKAETGLDVQLDNGEVIHCNQMMAATGRKPNVSGLGLEQAGAVKKAQWRHYG